VFVVPHDGLAYVGTTDTDYDGPLDDPQCTPEDIDYLLRAINGACVNEIRREHIVGTWAGLRPLVKQAASGRTADLSRRHSVRISDSGVVTITGGKLTTYRRMAQDTVDTLLKKVLPPNVATRAAACRTKKLALRGAEGYDSVVTASSAYPSVTTVAARHLADRYGGEARALMGMIESDPTLAAPLVEGLPYLRAEAVFAARYEMATSVDDVLSRRTRARLWGRDAASAAADDVAALLAPVLGWSPDQAAESAAAFRSLCEEERRAGGLDPSVAGVRID
jgi:glycerol-3-phosphate dehydrogenase